VEGYAIGINILLYAMTHWRGWLVRWAGVTANNDQPWAARGDGAPQANGVERGGGPRD